MADPYAQLDRALQGGQALFEPWGTIKGSRGQAAALADAATLGVLQATFIRPAVLTLHAQTSQPVGGVFVVRYGIANGEVTRELTPDTVTGIAELTMPASNVDVTWRNTSGAPQAVVASALCAPGGAAGGL